MGLRGWSCCLHSMQRGLMLPPACLRGERGPQQGVGCVKGGEAVEQGEGPRLLWGGAVELLPPTQRSLTLSPACWLGERGGTVGGGWGRTRSCLLWRMCEGQQVTIVRRPLISTFPTHFPHLSTSCRNPASVSELLHLSTMLYTLRGAGIIRQIQTLSQSLSRWDGGEGETRGQSRCRWGEGERARGAGIIRQIQTLNQSLSR